MSSVSFPGEERRVHPRRAADRVTVQSPGYAAYPADVAPAMAGVAPLVREDTRGLRVSWGGIWGGVLAGLGTLMLLSTLGLAVGFTAADPGETTARSLGIGAGIWSVLALLIALFVGGMVATRVGLIHDRTTGAFEGALVWVLSMLLLAYMATTGVRTLLGGAFNLVGGAAQTVGAVAGASGAEFSTGTVDEIVQRLRDPQTARVVAGATGMPEADVRESLSQTAARVEAARNNPAQAAAEAREGVADIYNRARAEGRIEAAAERVQEGAATTAWVTFGVMLVTLAMAVWGAMTGRRRAAERLARANVPVGSRA